MVRAFYPLTSPLTIDPSAVSVEITVGANHAHTVERVMIQIVAALTGAAIVAGSILLTYRYAARVGQWIGRTGMMVIVRLSAFIDAVHRCADRLEWRQSAPRPQWGSVPDLRGPGGIVIVPERSRRTG